VAASYSWEPVTLGMFVYLDETGDTGFKFDRGSSRFFLVTILLVPDPLPLNSAIDDLRSAMHFTADYEFKFMKSSHKIRCEFLKTIIRHDALIRCLVVDKSQLTQPHMRKRETFYNYLVKLLLKYDNGRLEDARLILDQREKGKKSKQGLATYLRREINPLNGGMRKIADVRYHESHRDNLLQAVDMVSGAINAYYAKDQPEYRQILQGRIDDIWEFKPR